MPAPTLSPAEIARLTAEKAKAESAAATFTAAIAAQQARAAELAVADGAFKKFFDYYNDNIIGKYDEERRWLSGYTLTSPVIEADIIACASLQGGRIQPSLPATDVIRIAQFDGTPFTTNPAHEQQHITDQAATENTLVNGYGGVTPAATILTNSALTSSSTTLQLKDLTTTFAITPGSTYIISDGINLAVVQIDTFVMQVSPVPPPYIANCNITLIVPPSGTIPIGENLIAFNGFTNGERTTKTASNPDLQGLMDYLVNRLNTQINSRITDLNGQLAAISTNEDPEPGTELTTATTNVNTSKTFLLNYISGGSDISNTGISSLSTERATRGGQITARLAEITNAYTGRSLNYYDARYNFANNRANTSRGSLRVQKAAEQTADQSQTFADTLTAQAGAISDILP